MNNIKKRSLLSERLIIEPLALGDSTFIRLLFNTKDWLKYIGDRNIHTLKDAEKYIEAAIANQDAAIWTMKQQDNPLKPVGIITFIRRDNLIYPDIGYALLPNGMKKGFAKEGVSKIIYELKKIKQFDKINAITLPENLSSVSLLQKLNFKFEKEIDEKHEKLHLYSLELLN